MKVMTIRNVTEEYDLPQHVLLGLLQRSRIPNVTFYLYLYETN